MRLNECIVDSAALEWFGEQTRVAPALIPALCLRLSPLRSGSQREKEQEREAIRRLKPVIPGGARATGKRYFQVRMEWRQKP